MPGGKVSDILRKIKQLEKKYEIKRIIIHVGSNNIPNDEPTPLVSEISAMLREIQELMPNTKLYYSDILPKINDNYIEGIHFVNTSVANLKRMAGSRKIFRVHLRFIWGAPGAAPGSCEPRVHTFLLTGCNQAVLPPP